MAAPSGTSRVQYDLLTSFLAVCSSAALMERLISPFQLWDGQFRSRYIDVFSGCLKAHLKTHLIVLSAVAQSCRWGLIAVHGGGNDSEREYIFPVSPLCISISSPLPNESFVCWETSANERVALQHFRSQCSPIHQERFVFCIFFLLSCPPSLR